MTREIFGSLAVYNNENDIYLTLPYSLPSRNSEPEITFNFAEYERLVNPERN